METLQTDIDYLINCIRGCLLIQMDDKFIALREGNELDQAVTQIDRLQVLLQGKIIDDRYVIEETA